MSVSRRSFLKSGAQSVLAAGVVLKFGQLAAAQDLKRTNPEQDFEIPYEAKTNPVFYYTRETFEPYLNGVFVARGVGGKEVQLKLTRIHGYNPGPNTKLMKKKARETKSFSLVFEADEPLSELTSIYKLEHAALGKFELFLTRVDNKPGRILYEAVINHVV
jgi:hypothetical protein